MLRPRLTEVRETFTRGGPWVSIEKLLLGFFLVLLKLHGGPKKWRNLAYFQRPSANFLLSRPNAAEYCNSEEKKLLSTDGCSTRAPGLVNFGLQTPEIHASFYFFRNLAWPHTLKFFKTYGRPLSVAWAKYMLCFANVIFLFIFYGRLMAQVNGGSRNFYTRWTLSVNREVTTWIISWFSLNYRVSQKVTKFGIFWDPARKLSALTPERWRIL